MRFRLISIIVVSGLLAAAAVALAAKPIKGDRYSTATGSSPNVSFTAASAKKLTSFDAGLALHATCPCGGFGGIEDLTGNSVKVKKGKFKFSGSILSAGAPGHQKRLGTETVTGKFVSSTKVKGKVTSHITIGTGPHAYHGVTKSYTATVVPAG